MINGLARAIVTVLSHLNEQINPVYIKKFEVAPIFDIKLELFRNQSIQFDPEIEEVQNGQSIRNIVRSWMNDIFFTAGQF